MGGQESKLGWAPETFHDGARRRLTFWGGVSGEGDGSEGRFIGRFELFCECYTVSIEMDYGWIDELV